MYDFELNFGGNQIRMWTSGGPNGLKHNWTWNSHNHADYEIHVLLKGHANVDVEGTAYELKEHQTILVAPGMYHCRLPEEGKITRLCLNFSIADGPLLRSLKEKVPVCALCPADDELVSACKSILKELDAEKLFHRVMIQGHLIRLMVSMFRVIGVDCALEGAPEVRNAERHIHQIDLFFESHLKHGAKIDDLAAKLFLSKGQLSRLLLESYGMTFREKLLRARMSQAARLLRHTDMPVYKIAEEVGYTAASSFYHVFRSWHGMTPEKYRAENQAKEA